MDKTLDLQHRIRNNAAEMSAVMADMAKWETSAKHHDKFKTLEKKNRDIRRPHKSREIGTVPIKCNRTVKGLS